MTSFHQFHKTLERLPWGVYRIMSDQIGTAHSDFVMRRWIVVDGYVQSGQISHIGMEMDEDVVIDHETESYTVQRINTRIKVSPRPLSEITIFTPNIPRWLRDLTDALGFEENKRAKVQELIAGHLWHLGDLRVPKSSRTIPIYVACHVMKVKEQIDQILESRLRPDSGIIFVATREKFDSPLLPRGHQFAGLDELFMCDGFTPDLEMLERMTQVQEQRHGSIYFEERSGVLLLSHFEKPRSFSGKQRKVIAYFWKHRTVEFMKWSDVVRDTDCGKDPGSVFGPDWSQYLERSTEGRGRYRIRCSKS